MAHIPDDEWAAARLAVIAPAWTPDETRARVLSRSAPVSRTRIGWYGTLGATAALLVAIAVFPPGRTFAQALWYRLFVTRVEVVRLDFSNVPLDSSIRTDGAHVPVANLAEAAARAGFMPRLAPDAVRPEPPALSVTGAIALTQTIRTAPLRAALDRVGASDVEVHDAWDGLTVRATIGPLVIADYSDDVSIIQAAPIRMELPTQFPLAQFAEAVFRAAGASWWEARALAETYATSPAWLLDVPKDQPAGVETIPMPDGAPAVVVDEFSDGVARSTVIVSRPAGIVVVSSPTRDIGLRIAEAMTP